MSRWWLSLALAAGAASPAAASAAEAPSDRGWSLEASVLDVDTSGYRGYEQMPPRNLFRRDDRGVTVKGSYAFTRSFALQAGYYDFGGIFATYRCDTPVCPMFLVAITPVEADLDGLSLAAVGSWHITERVELFGKLGAFRSDLDGVVLGSVDDRSSGIMGGAGVGVWLTPRWRLGLQYERLDLDLKSTGVGATFRF